MIILTLVVFNKEQINEVVNKVLKNKWALNVFVGHAMDSYYMAEATVQSHSGVHLIQFATKSLLFTEIETTLQKEFPAMDFFIYAAPVVHVDTLYYEKIKNGIPGLTLLEKELLNP